MISILTATCNRAYVLPRLFQSLCNQTVLNFEWIVVDDGSTDGTSKLIEDFTSRCQFNICYVHQSNTGKHGAINVGSNLSKNDWVFIVDSDDALTSDAVSIVIENIKKNPAKDILGFCFRKCHFNGALIGKKIDWTSEIFLHPSEAAHLFEGDLAYIFRRSSLVAHPSPIINNEKFVPELYIWSKIGDAGRILYFTNQLIYLCEYLIDGYSKNFHVNLKRNPRGFLLFYVSQFSREKRFRNKLKCAVRVLQCLSYATRNLI